MNIAHVSLRELEKEGIYYKIINLTSRVSSNPDKAKRISISQLLLKKLILQILSRFQDRIPQVC